MKSVFMAFVLTLSSAALVACSKDKDSQGSPSNPSPEPCCAPTPTKDPSLESSAQYTINGENPKDYYARFNYQPTPDCDHAQYLHAGNWEIYRGKDESGNERKGELYLYILEDGTYFAQYKEYSVLDRQGTQFTSANEKETKFKSRWRIEGDEIVFDNLGRGKGVLENERRTIWLVFDRDFFGTGLSGELATINSLNGNNVPFPEIDNCPRD
jgi:hypothetical protein